MPSGEEKILLYLIMTSRLMDNPLHGILISRMNIALEDSG